MPQRFESPRSRYGWDCPNCGDGIAKDAKCPHCGTTEKDQYAPSVLDALESKTASGQCPECGGPSTYLGERNGKVYYKCRKCGVEHSSKPGKPQPGEFQDFEEEMGHKLFGESKVADVLSEPAIHNPNVHLPSPSQPARSTACTNCGAPIAPFVSEHGLTCPHCGQQQSFGQIPRAARNEGKTADASYPPDTQLPQQQTAQPYNPAAYEQMVGDMHPAAKYAYERATQQGVDPQQAMQQAQQKQQEMLQRSTEGQDIQNVQIPVIGRADDVSKNPVQEILDSYDRGFVPESVVTKAAKLLK